MGSLSFCEQPYVWNKEVWAEHVDSVCRLLGKYIGYIVTMEALDKHKVYWFIYTNGSKTQEARGEFEKMKDKFFSIEPMPILE